MASVDLFSFFLEYLLSYIYIHADEIHAKQPKLMFVTVFAAIMTAAFPCLTFGQIAEVLDEGEMSKGLTLVVLFMNNLLLSFMLY